MMMLFTRLLFLFLFLFLPLLPCLRTVQSSPHGPRHDNDPDPVPYYTIEEHWASPALVDLFATNPITTLLGVAPLLTALSEIGPVRLASMDAGNVHVQVVSHAPTAAEAMYLANNTRLANDQLAARLAAHPERFRGFGVLPMGLPAQAAAELRRCVAEHGFVGALVDAHVTTPAGLTAFFDGGEYDLLWAAAVELDVPIYLHPTFPPLGEILSSGQGLYAPLEAGGYSGYDAAALGTAAWGWHSQTALSFLRMYLGGVFERFPTLQVVLGHMGELVPYYLWRADRYLSVNRTVQLRDVFRRNLHVTTSGIFSLEPMATLLKVTDTKRVLYSVDWPFAKNEDGKAFMETLRQSGMVSQEEFRDIAYRNSQRLLKLGGHS
ncbi:hypothetical protein ACEPPN_004023 [Leptodophora sp. 'Broadleaf-Isolate-01']